MSIIRITNAFYRYMIGIIPVSPLPHRAASADPSPRLENAVIKYGIVRESLSLTAVIQIRPSINHLTALLRVSCLLFRRPVASVASSSAAQCHALRTGSSRPSCAVQHRVQIKGPGACGCREQRREDALLVTLTPLSKLLSAMTCRSYG